MFARIMLLLALAAFSYSQATAATDRSDVHVEMGGIKQQRYDKDGKLAAVIRAERGTVNDEGMLLMEGVESTVYTDDGEKVEIRALKAKVNTEGTGDAIFQGDIRLALQDFVATTSRATWRESDGTVRGSDEIVLEGIGSRIVGSGFVVFASENKAVIYEPRGTIRLDKAKSGSKSKKAEDALPVPRESTGEPLRSHLDE